VSKVDIGIWMFDTSYAGYGFSPKLTGRIADIENVCGIKCSRPLQHYAEVQKLCGEKIVMSHPAETEWLTLMRDYGARVHMSSAAPFLLQTPAWRLMRDYTELGLQGRFAEAEAVSKQLDPLRDVHERWLRDPWLKHKIIPIVYLKAWTEMLGLAAGPVRPPLLQITSEECQTLREDLEKTGLLARVPAVHQARAA